jgi:FkbM family methyltransferase
LGLAPHAAEEGMNTITIAQAAQAGSVPFARPPHWFLPLPVLKGSLRGALWLPACGGKLARVLLGTYEREQTRLFRQLVRPGDAVLDVGAAAGYYTLLASRLVGKKGRVLAFEPDPQNAFYLQWHLRLNRARNVKPHTMAVANDNGHARFGGGTGTGTASLCGDGEIVVTVGRLDDVLAGLPHRINHIKIDVEGAELEVLEGGRQLIEKHRPTLFLSTHGACVHRDCCQWLQTMGYRLSPIGGADLQSATEVLCQAA